MSEFTKGPWEIYYEGSGDYLVVQSESRDEVCGVSRPDAHFMHVGKGAPINEANASLIAAAPDMYELLKAWLHHFGSTNDMSGRTREVLAKAEGKQ